MKKIIKSSILFVVLLSTIFVIVSFIQSNSSEKEVLLVETYVSVEPGGYGLAIFHNDRPTEFILMNYKSIYATLNEDEDPIKKLIKEKGKILKSTLQKLYNDGWELEGTNGGDGFQKYILTK